MMWSTTCAAGSMFTAIGFMFPAFYAAGLTFIFTMRGGFYVVLMLVLLLCAFYLLIHCGPAVQSPWGQIKYILILKLNSKS